MKIEEVLRGVKKDRDILRTAKRRKFDWIFRIFCRKYLLKYVSEGTIVERIDVTGR